MNRSVVLQYSTEVTVYVVYHLGWSLVRESGLACGESLSFRAPSAGRPSERHRDRQQFSTRANNLIITLYKPQIST